MSRAPPNALRRPPALPPPRCSIAGCHSAPSHAVSIAGVSRLPRYGCAHVVEEILLSAFERGVAFKVVVLDARPHWEGRALWRRLVDKQLHVSYAGMHALSYAMRTATKVLMGAHACLSNGAVVSRAGSALIALCATRANVPVLIACETYKFAERVMLDSICANELGDPDDLITVRLAGRGLAAACAVASCVRAACRHSRAANWPDACLLAAPT